MIMKGDKELLEKYGKKNPFKTPDGYFEHFHEKLMETLPATETIGQETDEISLFTRIKPWLYMAALFISTIFVVQGLMYIQDTKFSTEPTNIAEDIYAEEADHFMSTSLYNEYSLYSYLTSNEIN